MKLIKRAIPVAALALLAAACGSSSTGSQSGGSSGNQAASATTSSGPLMNQFALRTAMRTLWEDHVTWTRVFIIDAVAGLPDTNVAAQRLLQNQTDIGNAIKPFYGAAAGDQLTTLLRDHILTASDLLTAAKSGDTTKLAAAKTRWYDNADQIATFLARANPNWPLADLKAMMRTHLDQTMAEATARLTGEWAADVTAYDGVVHHILDMADTLSDGIAKQFPDKVAGGSTLTGKNEDLHVALRALWEDHVTWTRVFIIDAVAGLPDTNVAAQRLLQNQTDIGNAIKPFYGEAAGNQLTALLRDHILTASDLLTAAKSGDATKLAAAKTRWYDNADQIATFLAGANPNWPLADLKAMMRTHLDQTLAEATARLTGDWAADITAYDGVVHHILDMADTLGDGIAKQFPDKVQ